MAAGQPSSPTPQAIITTNASTPQSSTNSGQGGNNFPNQAGPAGRSGERPEVSNFRNTPESHQRKAAGFKALMAAAGVGMCAHVIVNKVCEAFGGEPSVLLDAASVLVSFGIAAKLTHGRNGKTAAKVFAGPAILAALSLALPRNAFVSEPSSPTHKFIEGDTVIVIHPGGDFSGCYSNNKPFTRPLQKDEVLLVQVIGATEIGAMDKNGIYGSLYPQDVEKAAPGVPSPAGIVPGKTIFCTGP